MKAGDRMRLGPRLCIQVRGGQKATRKFELSLKQFKVKDS
jgi:hypothetical protein